MDIIVKIVIAVLVFALLMWLLPWLAVLASITIPRNLIVLVSLAVAILVYFRGPTIK